MKRLLSLMLLVIPLWISAQTIFIRALHDEGKTIKVTYSNNTYDYILKGNVGRVIFFGSNPTALTIEMVRYGGSTNDATYRINTTQLTSPSNVPTSRALADTLNKWLQTSFGSLGGTVDSIYFRGDTLFYNIIGEGERSVGIVDTVIAGLQTLSLSGDTLSISSGNSIVLPLFGSSTEVIVFQTDQVANLNNYNILFQGNIVDGDTLVRDFDANGNDLGGVNNSVGNSSLLNQIVGGRNSIGSNCIINNIIGFDNTIQDDCGVNLIIGFDNTIQDDCSANVIFGSLNELGDSSNVNFLAGANLVVSNNVQFSAAWGEGHNVTCDFSYMFGRWGVCPGGGLAIGNGTDNLNRNNSHLLKDNGSYQHDGAYANKPTINTAGGDATIPDNLSVYIYNPASLQATVTLTLPANPLDGQRLLILAGGTLTGTVATIFALLGNGNAIIGTVPTTLVAGIVVELVFSDVTNAWYVK